MWREDWFVLLTLTFTVRICNGFEMLRRSCIFRDNPFTVFLLWEKKGACFTVTLRWVKELQESSLENLDYLRWILQKQTLVSEPCLFLTSRTENRAGKEMRVLRWWIKGARCAVRARWWPHCGNRPGVLLKSYSRTAWWWDQKEDLDCQKCRVWKRKSQQLPENDTRQHFSKCKCRFHVRVFTEKPHMYPIKLLHDSTLLTSALSK